MVFALGAGKLFDLHHPGEFEETILGKSSRSEHNPRLPEGVNARKRHRRRVENELHQFVARLKEKVANTRL